MNILEYENYQEKKSHGDPLFPYITYPCSIPLDFHHVPLHWHDEVEIIYVKKGCGTITVDFSPCRVTAGTIVLIIPGRLHSIEQHGQECMEYENIIFHPNILLSRNTDTSSTDILQPLLSGSIALPLLYTPESEGYLELSACIDANDEILLYSRCGVREHPGKQRKSFEKMKLVLKYIENHYMDKITIEEIAAEAGLSQSHFMKYFKNMMGTSFTRYLNEYRLIMASRLLVSSDASILDIAAEVGFENLSYFNRTFKKRFSQTPREYRKERT